MFDYLNQEINIWIIKTTIRMRGPKTKKSITVFCDRFFKIS